MSYQQPPDDSYLDEIGKPPKGWNAHAAVQVNDMVKRLAAQHNWWNLVVHAHPDAWNSVLPYLTYNRDFRIDPGIQEDIDFSNDPHRIIVTYRAGPKPSKAM